MLAASRGNGWNASSAEAPSCQKGRMSTGRVIFSYSQIIFHDYLLHILKKEPSDNKEVLSLQSLMTSMLTVLTLP